MKEIDNRGNFLKIPDRVNRTPKRIN